MKIKMLETKLGSPNGIDVEKYEKGNEYEMEGHLLEVFLKHGWAEKVEIKMEKVVYENKMISKIEENKKIEVIKKNDNKKEYRRKSK